MKKWKCARIMNLCLCLLLVTLLGGCDHLTQVDEPIYEDEIAIGNIYLYGEIHNVPLILDEELSVWKNYYDKGMRHLFVEQAYFTGQFLNIWMHEDNDEIFDLLFEDWHNTPSYSPDVRSFYMQIKQECPETIFHGTDVGHQFNTTGERYLEYLIEMGLEDSMEYQKAEANISQGKIFYKKEDFGYREACMTENFYSALGEVAGEDIMGIYGAAHTNLGDLGYKSDEVNMVTQLNDRYLVQVQSTDLTPLSLVMEPLKEENVLINGVTYRAFYFGEQDLTGFKNLAKRSYWRIEGAYDALKDLSVTGDNLPANNYIMNIDAGEIYIIDYTDIQGNTERLCYICDGSQWNGQLNTYGVDVDVSE